MNKDSTFKTSAYQQLMQDARKFTQAKRGFTIIETLVAITILMIAVAGPLVVASKGLNNALYARDQIVATYLAQESMEFIKNDRDANLSADVDTDWLANIADITSGGSSRECTDYNTRACDIMSGSNDVNMQCTYNQGGCQIYFDPTSGYSSVSGQGTRTIFSRYDYLTKPNNANTPCGVGDTECTVHVVVNWNEGTVPYDVTLNSELVNNTP